MSDNENELSGATGSVEDRPLTHYSNRDLVTLYQEKAACFAMFQTKVLFERTKEIDAELMRRLAAYPNNQTQPRGLNDLSPNKTGQPRPEAQP